MISSHVPVAHQQRGMTLIEILVTVVLISVGLLGIAALQLTTLKGNQEAYVRSQASVLAADILDRMRANRAGVRSGQYSEIDFNDTGDTSTPAGRDIEAWQTTIDTLLPGDPGVTGGSIDVQNNGDVYTVTIVIRWSERADAGTSRAADTPTFTTRTEI